MRIFESPKSRRFIPTRVRDLNESFTKSWTTVSMPEKMSSSISSRNLRLWWEMSRPSEWIRKTSSTRYVASGSTLISFVSRTSYRFSSKSRLYVIPIATGTAPAAFGRTPTRTGTTSPTPIPVIGATSFASTSPESSIWTFRAGSFPRFSTSKAYWFHSPAWRPAAGSRSSRFGYRFLMKFWIWMPIETSACLIRMSAIDMSLARSAASASGHRPLHDLLPLCVQESLLEVALQPVHGFEVVRGGRVPGMRPELLELLFVKAERNALLDETGERIDDGIEVSLSREVDLFVDTLRVPAHVLEFARIDHRLCPREELGSHPDVRPELRVSLNLRPQLGQFVTSGPRLPHPSRLVEDVLDDLLVLDRLDEPVVVDRLPRVREDRVRATRVQAGGSRVVHLARHVRHEVFRGRFQARRQPGRHLLRVREFPRDVRVTACVGRGFCARERLLRPQDRDVVSGEGPHRSPGGRDDRPRGLLGLPAGFRLPLRDGLQRFRDVLLRRPRVFDRVRVFPVRKVRLRGVEERDRAFHRDLLVPPVPNLAVRAVDQVFRGRHELVHELLGGRVQVRQDDVDVVEVPVLQGALGRPEAFLRPGDVDLRLPQVFDEFLDRDEFRRRAAGFLKHTPLVLLEP